MKFFKSSFVLALFVKLFCRLIGGFQQCLINSPNYLPFSTSPTKILSSSHIALKFLLPTST